MARRKSGFMSSLGTPLASIILENLPFVLFLGFLGTLYISNVHYAENTMRDIRKLESEISDLRWQYMAQKAELMYNSKHSEVLARVNHIGLSDKNGQTKKIAVDKTWGFKPQN